MEKSNNAFVPSEILNGIYDILENHIMIAANEDIHDRAIVEEVVDYVNNHPYTEQFTWEDYRNASDSGGVLIIAWLECDGNLHCEHFSYLDDEKTYWTSDEPDGPCADFFCF